MRRPAWAIIVAVGAIYSFLQVVARLLAERVVKAFDALREWDVLQEWWYVFPAAILLAVLLKAGYELWKDEEEARRKAEARILEAERERDEWMAKLGQSEQERFGLQFQIDHLKARLEASSGPPTQGTPGAAIVFEGGGQMGNVSITDSTFRGLPALRANASIDDFVYRGNVNDMGPGQGSADLGTPSNKHQDDAREAAREAIERHYREKGGRPESGSDEQPG